MLPATDGRSSSTRELPPRRDRCNWSSTDSASGQFLPARQRFAPGFPGHGRPPAGQGTGDEVPDPQECGIR